MNEEYNKIAGKIIETLNDVNKLTASRERAITFTKLEEALMWLMKADQMNAAQPQGPKAVP